MSAAFRANGSGDLLPQSLADLYTINRPYTLQSSLSSSDLYIINRPFTIQSLARGIEPPARSSSCTPNATARSFSHAFLPRMAWTELGADGREEQCCHRPRMSANPAHGAMMVLSMRENRAAARESCCGTRAAKRTRGRAVGAGRCLGPG